MKLFWPGISGVILVGLAGLGCAHDGKVVSRVPGAVRPVATTTQSAKRALPWFILDEEHSKGLTVDLGEGRTGAIVGGRRIIRGKEGVTIVGDSEPTGFRLTLAVPSHLGGGFLFSAEKSLFLSRTFDGALEPILRFSDPVASVSFGGKSAVVYTDAGDRHGVDLKSKAIVPVSPAGLIEIASVADGRVGVLMNGGHAMFSLDNGDHFTDITTRFQDAPIGVKSTEEGLVFEDGTAREIRVGLDGQIRVYETKKAKKKESPADPRWKAKDSTQRYAIRTGVSLDGATAVVAYEGLIARIDLATGAIVEVSTGTTPDRAPCEAFRAGNDIGLVCQKDKTSVVMTQLFQSSGPVIEKTFEETGRFYGTEGGWLLFSGGCAPKKSKTMSLCLRGPSGGWREIDASEAMPTVFESNSPPQVKRWILSEKGRIYAFIGSPVIGVWDLQTSSIRPMSGEAQNQLSSWNSEARRSDDAIIDRRGLAFDDGTIRGWADTGGFQIEPRGEFHRSAYTFDSVGSSGARAMSRTREGLFQSLDWGQSFQKVQEPIEGVIAARREKVNCSELGCELGTWLRFGWDRPNYDAKAPMIAVMPPVISGAVLPEIECQAKAAPRIQVLPGAESGGDPDNAGLGAMVLPSLGERAKYERDMIRRNLNHPSRSEQVNEPSNLRALLYGFAVESVSVEDDKRLREPWSVLTVQGPAQSVLGLKRDVWFVDPFDTEGQRKAMSYDMRSLMDAMKKAGGDSGEFFGNTDVGLIAATPMLSSERNSASQVLFALDGAMLMLSDGKAKAQLAQEPNIGAGWIPISAIAKSSEERVILEQTAEGAQRIVTWSKQLGPRVTWQFGGVGAVEHSLANPDALGIGSDGTVVIIRTPSGSLAATDQDPAFAISMNGVSTPLAAWASLSAANSSECVADKEGYRAIIQTRVPWVKLSGWNATEPQPSLMLVNWGKKRVCLEALEIGVGTTSISSRTEIETFVVARFGATPAAGQVALLPGIEYHQAMSCGLKTK